MHKLACCCADWLYHKADNVTASKDQIRYGIEVILGALVKGLFIFGLALFHGFYNLLFLCLLAFGVARMYIGGIHLGKLWQCSIVSSLLLNGIVMAAINMPTYLIMPVGIVNIGLFCVIAFKGPTTMRHHLKGKLKRGLPFCAVVLGAMGISIATIITSGVSVTGRVLLLATLASAMLYFKLSNKEEQK